MQLRRSIAAVALVAAAACGSDNAAVPDDGASDETTAAIDTAVDTTVVDDTVVDDESTVSTVAASEQMYPDVIDATAEFDGSTWTISATLSSPYDSPERYADAWRVVGPDSTVFGERILTHDHASEQPFTRSESGIEIPENVEQVTIEGRDLENGYGGDTFRLTLPR